MSRKPDYSIEGNYWDNYAPRTKNIRQIIDTIGGKVNKEQARRIIIDLDKNNIDIDLGELMNQLNIWKNTPGSGIDLLEELFLIKDGKIIQFFRKGM